jgi:hypothetical protein
MGQTRVLTKAGVKRPVPFCAKPLHRGTVLSRIRHVTIAPIGAGEPCS